MNHKVGTNDGEKWTYPWEQVMFRCRRCSCPAPRCLLPASTCSCCDVVIDDVLPIMGRSISMVKGMGVLLKL